MFLGFLNIYHLEDSKNLKCNSLLNGTRKINNNLKEAQIG